MNRFVLAIGIGVCAVVASAQTPSKSFVGTVAGFRPDSAEVEIKPDSGAAVVAKLTPETIAQRVAPGEKDLKKAQNIQAPTSPSATACWPRSKAARSTCAASWICRSAISPNATRPIKPDWNSRGVSGVVVTKNGNEVTVKMRTMTGEVHRSGHGRPTRPL